MFDQGIGSVVSRRDFLRVGGLGVVSLSAAEKAALARRGGDEGRSVILLLMSGGASQLETFDPKPEAPSGVRGPLKAISTSVPGLAFSEGLPRLAERAGRVSIVRSMNHTAAPIHETGLQLLQTGRLARGGQDFPSFGAVTARVLGPGRPVPGHVVLPRQIDATGVNMGRGQGAAFLGSSFEPTEIDGQIPEVFSRRHGAVESSELPGLESEVFASESETVRRDYGDTRFGRLCCRARQLVERGVAVVTINLFDRLDGQVTWDVHAAGAAAPGTLFDYRDTLCPQFDQAASALLDDLGERGLLDALQLLLVNFRMVRFGLRVLGGKASGPRSENQQVGQGLQVDALAVAHAVDDGLGLLLGRHGRLLGRHLPFPLLASARPRFRCGNCKVYYYSHEKL